MGPGVPGMGIASFFYVAAALAAPLREIVRSLRGRSSRQRWQAVGLQFWLAVSIVAAVIALYVGFDLLIEHGFLTAPEVNRLPGGWSNWVYAVGVLVFVLCTVTAVAWIYATWASWIGSDDDAELIAEAHRSSVPSGEFLPTSGVIRGRHLASPRFEEQVDVVIDLDAIADAPTGRHLAGAGIAVAARLAFDGTWLTDATSSS